MITIDMTRREGPLGVALVELSSKRKQKYIVRTDIQPYQTEEANGVTFIEQRFDYKPTLDEIKEFVLGVINAETDEKILSGFVWTSASGEEIPVWLSTENQFNFKSAYDLAVQKNGATLPVTFKMGERNGVPVYHTFETMEEAEDFYVHAVAFINHTLTEGWTKKDSTDWTQYEQALQNLE
jgi:hypothetical protein